MHSGLDYPPVMSSVPTTWAQLSRLRLSWFLTMIGFILYAVAAYAFGVEWIHGVLRRHQLSVNWVPLFVLPMLLPNLIVARRLRTFRCPACDGRFAGAQGLFRRHCATCDAAPPK